MKPKLDRQRVVAYLRDEEDASFASIGQVLDVTSTRVKQIYDREKRAQRENRWDDGKLPIAIYHALCADGIRSRQELKKAIPRLEDVPNIGPKARQTIHEYLAK